MQHDDVDIEMPPAEEKGIDPANRLVLARRSGLMLPMTMILKRLGRQRRLYEGGKAILVVVLAFKPDWVSCVASAVRVSAHFDRVSEPETSDRARKLQEKDFLMQIARGHRQAIVAASRRDVPESLLNAADIVIEIGHPTPDELAEAVRGTALGQARGLAAASPQLDLLDAVAAIRQNERASTAVARLLALRPRPLPNKVADDVPRVEELHGFGAAAVWAKRLLADLESWRRGEIDFASFERHVVLCSPPGLGKTTFARALAKSAGLPIRVSSMGTLFSTTTGFLDAVTKAIDALFAPETTGGPFMVLLDELDAFPNRATLESRHAEWWTTVITHLLTRLDGASNRDDLAIVIGATNFPNRLDKALIRPGRMNRLIHIGPPSEADIIGIMRQHLRADLPDIDLAPFAALAQGSSGAQIEAWIKSARTTARQAGRSLSSDDLLAQIAPTGDHSPTLLDRIAVHEAGHALACHVLGVGDVRSVAIAGADSLGHVSIDAPKNPLPRREDLRRAIVMVLAGRAAEEVLLGDASAGAGGPIDSDLARATSLVEQMHLSLGLGGDIRYRGTEALMRSDVSMRIEAELERLYDETLDFVRRNRDAVRRVADALIADRILSASRFLSLVEEPSTAGKETPHA